MPEVVAEDAGCAEARVRGQARRAAGGSTAWKCPQPIGAPYAQRRGYVAKRGGALEATPRGRLLAAFLGAFFGRYVDYGFTAALEASLDAVSGARGRRRAACINWTVVGASSQRCTARYNAAQPCKLWCLAHPDGHLLVTGDEAQQGSAGWGLTAQQAGEDGRRRAWGVGSVVVRAAGSEHAALAASAAARGAERGRARAGGSERWGDVLQAFWGPFRDNLAQVAGVSMTDVIDVLDARLGARFFPPQACPLHTSVGQLNVHSRRWY
jgi:hypothetical protein